MGDTYNTGPGRCSWPKLNPYEDCIFINDFNESLRDVFEDFCRKNNLQIGVTRDKFAVKIDAPRKVYEKYIEQLKLFYL